MLLSLSVDKKNQQVFDCSALFIFNLGLFSSMVELEEKMGSYIFWFLNMSICFIFSQQHMNDKQAANTAIANLDGYNIKGQRMRVEVSVSGLVWKSSVSAVDVRFPKDILKQM